MSERELLEKDFADAVAAHKTHPPAWRLDPDGIHRCPECDPVPPRLPTAREVRCPGEPACCHPSGHVHLEYENGHGQVWSGEGQPLDPFDLSRPDAVLMPHLPRNPVARGYWFVARAVVMWWDRAVDAVQDRRRR